MEGDSMNNSRSTTDVVGEFIRYQQTGHDFASAWAGIEPIVTGFAVYQLRKMGITRPCGGKGRARHEAGRSAFAVDDAALKDVVHDTVVASNVNRRPSGLRNSVWLPSSVKPAVMRSMPLSIMSPSSLESSQRSIKRSSPNT